MHIVVPDPTVNRPERCEQPGPGIVSAFEQFFAVLIGQFAQLLADGRDGIVEFEDGEGFAGDQFAFFSTEQEDQPHHDGEGRFVELLGGDVGQQGAAEVLIGPVE